MKRPTLHLILAVHLIFSTVNAKANLIDSEKKDIIQTVVDDYFKKYSKKEQFTAISASVLFPHNGPINLDNIKTVMTGRVGYPPFSEVINFEHVFDIGSITKSFTSLILLQLQTEGKLSLNDSLGKWLPQYSNWSGVTLRQLLNMTSGIPNYSGNPEFEKSLERDLGHVWTDEELLLYAHPEKPIEINQKNRFDYSNSNYILAGLVIEKITHDTFANQLKKRIINQSHSLNHTFYPAGPDGNAVRESISDRKIHGYYFDTDDNKIVDTFSNDLSWAGAAGAIVANTEDVLRWVQLLYHGSLINPIYRESTLAELESVVSVKTGLPIPTVTENDTSGFGLGVGYYYDIESGLRFWTYQGSTLGFRVMYLWQPCNNVTTVVALNSKADANPDSKMGNHIIEANMNLYNTIIEHHPQLSCALLN
ncbi:D-alanyl-D-alanine carboxypeptidase [Legionella antarctica]|uniref:D-alanyl-D-alanine carboxypeptidase n=1 Tax=Legionella antarctica TaxID=2708020 RepID=A0A6F8T8W3_9GAMM|nr:serine hydrolase domain-containing protein [Legionella antarctica]BCA96891.1 D-alanyl-D-alanine carboxypeptidase [Legionella antarctica]